MAIFTRRAAMVGAAASTVVAVPAVASVTGSDARLVQLCAEFTALRAEIDRLGKEESPLPYGSARQQELEATTTALVERYCDLRGEISETPALTPQGLLTKARVALTDLSPKGDWPEHYHAWMAWSVLEDFVGRSA